MKTDEISKLMRATMEASARGYKVTTSGQVISPSGRVLRLSVNQQKHGSYLVFGYRYAGQALKIYVHQLQALQLYSNALLNKGVEVAHRDGDSHNNNASNIVVCTHLENERMKTPDRLARPRSRKRVFAHLGRGCSGMLYDSVKQCARALGLHPTTISHALRGDRLTAGGWFIIYADMAGM